jgi:hypothetical protein
MAPLDWVVEREDDKGSEGESLVVRVEGPTRCQQEKEMERRGAQLGKIASAQMKMDGKIEEVTHGKEKKVGGFGERKERKVKE